MSAKLKLSISEPCHENWHQMNPTEQGRFCNACAKEVVDFTGMSDTEVLNYFLDKKKGNVCGRLYNDQMNREIQKPVYTKRRMAWYWNYFIMMFILLFKNNAGKSQIQIKPIQLEQINGRDTLKHIRMGGISAGVDIRKEISGRITDENGVAVAGATIQVKGKQKATVTDANGNYRLAGTSKDDLLQVSAVGYCSKEIKAGTSTQVSVLKQAMLGEVVVAGGISFDYEYTPPVIPRHVAIIEVRDDITHLPVKAKITVTNNDVNKPVNSITNKNGIYKLRGIKEQESYQLTVSADGYTDTTFNINGWNFNDRKESRYMFLKKDEKAFSKSITIGAVSSYIIQPIYIVDGQLSNVEKVAAIKSEEIASIEVLKDEKALSIFGKDAEGGVIVITTKKEVVFRAVNENVQVKNKVIDQKLIYDFIIAPNPVQKGNNINFSFVSKLKGEYNLQVLNLAGVVIESKKIYVAEKVNVFQLQTKTTWASGVYNIVINSKTDILLQGKFIIE